MNVETVTLEDVQKDLHILQLAMDALRAKVDKLASKQGVAVKGNRPLNLTDLDGPGWI